MTAAQFVPSYSSALMRRVSVHALFQLRDEFWHITKIASPLIMTSLVTMSISITDVVMVGRLGKLSLAAAAAASDFYSIFFYLIAGVAAAISPMVAQARGKHQFRHGKAIVLLGAGATSVLAIPASFILYHTSYVLALFGVDASIVSTALPYGRMMAMAIFPLLLTMVLHYFLAANKRTHIIFIVTLLAFPINLIGNYVLIYGHFGVAPMGLAGAGLATAITGVFMCLFMSAYVLRHASLRRYWKFPFRLNSALCHLGNILKIGVPIGVSHLGEMGVFLLMTMVMGVFGVDALAAHVVSFRLAGVVYAFPLGYGQAATVRVANLVGQRNGKQILVALKTALLLALACGLSMFLLILLSRHSLIDVLLINQGSNISINMQASLFLMLLACMQIPINLGTVGAGILRGYKDTKIPMIYSLSSYWGIGFIGAMILAFFLEFNGVGLWIGLVSATSSFAALIIYRVWKFHWITSKGSFAQ